MKCIISCAVLRGRWFGASDEADGPSALSRGMESAVWMSRDTYSRRVRSERDWGEDSRGWVGEENKETIPWSAILIIYNYHLILNCSKLRHHWQAIRLLHSCGTAKHIIFITIMRAKIICCYHRPLKLHSLFLEIVNVTIKAK